MNPILFQTTDWSTIPATDHPGESGFAKWKTVKLDKLRIRLVEYSANYKANHWCQCGHIVYCLEGELTSELADGSVFMLSQGMSYHVSDDVSSHRSYSKEGAKLLIIDGDFLKTQYKKTLNPWKM